MNYTESFVPITDPILKQFNSYTEELELWANKGIKYIRYVIDMSWKRAVNVNLIF